MTDTWLDYLNQAKAEPTGIAVMFRSSNDADIGKRQLYAARAKARDEGNKTFDSLSISMSPHSDEILYIYESEATHESPEVERPTVEAGNSEDL